MMRQKRVQVQSKGALTPTRGDEMASSRIEGKQKHQLPQRRRALQAGVALALCGATLLAGMGNARAQAWPEKPIKILIPFAAGGNTDIVARLISPDLSKALGQPVVVENRPGVAGNIAAEAVARSTPDGYTLLMGTVGTQAINPSLYKKVSFDALKDFQAITLITTVPNVLVVNPSMPVKTPAELIAYGRANKGLSFASSGAGSSIHLSGEMFKAATGLDMTHIAYKSSAQAVTDLVGGQVQLMFDNLPTSLPFIQNGKLKALAVTSSHRAPQLPNVPTMMEMGMKDFETGSWFGLLAPAKTPMPVVEKINAAVQAIVMKPEFEQRLLQLGAQRMVLGPVDFQKFIAAEHKKWAAVVQKSGASLD
jgi:tripartite-type tricarboxylate transporter receptor subunit TctC